MIRFGTRVGRRSWVSMPLWLAVFAVPLYLSLLLLEWELRIMVWLTIQTVVLMARALRKSNESLTRLTAVKADRKPWC